LAYSISIDGKEYVLPAEWLQKLENKWFEIDFCTLAPPFLKNAPPKMILHPLDSKGGAFVLKLWSVFRKRP
jgi:hypothetical protein